jgi:hypothetical protein
MSSVPCCRSWKPNKLKYCFLRQLKLFHLRLRGIWGWVLFGVESHSVLIPFYVESHSEFSLFGIMSLSVLSLFYVESHSEFSLFEVQSIRGSVLSGLSPFGVGSLWGWVHSGLSPIGVESSRGLSPFRVESIRTKVHSGFSSIQGLSSFGQKSCSRFSRTRFSRWIDYRLHEWTNLSICGLLKWLGFQGLILRWLNSLIFIHSWPASFSQQLTLIMSTSHELTLRWPGSLELYDGRIFMSWLREGRPPLRWFWDGRILMGWY